MLAAIIFIHILLLNVAFGYKSGAPTSMCASMMPHHKGATPQKTVSPYRISSSSASTHDGRISIKVDGGPFTGILLQARKNPEQPGALGSFVSLSNSVKTITCGNVTNSAVTHKDNSKKEELDLEWQAPPSMEDDITFIATVVSNFSTFWTGVVSQPIHVEKYIQETPELSENGIKSNFYDKCGTERDNCLGYPEGCMEHRTCQTIVTVTSGNELEFEMMSLDSKYVAVGLSEDRRMGGDYVAECVLEGDSVKAYESWNVPSRKENVRIPVRGSLKLQTGDFTNGNIYCLVKIASEDIRLENFVLDINKNSYFILLASGKEVKLQEGSTKTSGVAFHDVGYIASKSHLNVNKRTEKIQDSFYDGCNKEINCFGVPDNCIQDNNCKLVVSILTQGVKYRFRLKGESTAYIAVGLSHDDKMGDDSVMECVNNGRGVSAYMSWNKPGKTNTREGISQIGINLISGNISNGVMLCEFTRETVTVVEQKTFDLMNDKYVLLLASGSSLKENGVGFHDLIYTASSERRFLSDVRTLSTADKLLVRLHGAFMIAAWIGTTSIGIVLARYFKTTWVESSLCAKDLWFAWHRFFMLLTWCLTITGCVLIVVDVGDWVPEGSQKHAILGLITIVLCFIQPIGAAFRPHPSARNRPLFNWLHWFIGNAAHIIAIVTIFFAVPLNKAQLPDWVNWILVAFVAFYVFVHIILSFAGCISERRALKKIDSFPMKDMNTSRSNLNSAERKQDAPLAGFRKFILFIHIVYITGLTAALIVIIVLAPIGTQWESLQNRFMGM